MKTLVIYYSRGGGTRKLAEALAKERGADLYEVKTLRPVSVVGAFFKVPAAIGQKPGKVQPITVNMADYDHIVVMGPIWASHPAPPVNNIIMALPAGKAVELRMVSQGGDSESAKVIALVQKQGCTVESYVDETTGAKQG